MARRDTPAPPRDSAPDVPDDLDEADGLSPRDDLLAARITGLADDVLATHARLVESRVEAASVALFDATGTTFTDVVVDGLRAAWDGVTLRGIRVGYLSLPSAELADVRFVDCEIGTLDLPDATLTRVTFDSCRVDEVDTRGLTGTDLDLRGLDALAFTDPRALRGSTLSTRQVEQHAAAFAAAHGVHIAD
jgi:uncharacterized protein YjbI with pentapeptide repeats